MQVCFFRFTYQNSMPMRKLYPTTLITSSQDDSHMKTPRKSTISFLRNFARAYTFVPEVGTIVCN